MTFDVVRDAGLFNLSAKSPPDDVADALRRLQTAIPRDADTLAREAIRLRSIEALTAAGIKAPARLVDAALGPTTSDAGSDQAGAGRALFLVNPEPLPDPVDGALLLDGFSDRIRQHVALPLRAARTIALWILHCYVIDALSISPLLAVTSPTKRCGKTLLLIILRALVPRALPVSNITPSALFRAIEAFTPTLLIDEADTFVRNDDPELRGLINSGHTRGTALVLRVVGDDHEVRAFSTWAAKCLALIGALPATLADRAIEVQLKRRTANEAIGRLRQDRIDAECLPLRRAAARWALDQRDAIREADPEVPAALHDRASDCWRPLLAIADLVGGSWPAWAREAAVAIAANVTGEDDVAIDLLADVRVLLEDLAGDPVPTSQLLDQLVHLPDRPWHDWRNGRPLTGHGLARLLARFGIVPAGTVRTGLRTFKGYRRCAFEDAFLRYLPPIEASQCHNANDSGPEVAFSKRHNMAVCDALNSVTKPYEIGVCDTVTLRSPENGAVRGEDGEEEAQYDSDGVEL